MLAVPVLAEEHPLQPAATAPSAPPFDTQAFYAASPSSSSGHGGGAGKELWEDDVIAAGKWEEPPQVTSHLTSAGPAPSCGIHCPFLP